MKPAAEPGARIALVVILAGVAAALHVAKLPPAVPVLQRELGITLVQAGFLLSLVQLASMALGIVAGLVGDGIGLRRSMLTGLGLLTAAGFAGGFADGVQALLLLRAVEGLGFLMTTVPAPTLIARSVPPASRTRVLGFWGTFMPLGTALALLTGPDVMARIDWPGWWWLIAAISLAMAVWLALSVPPDPPRAGGDHGWPRRLRRTLGARGPWLLALTFAVYSAQWLSVIGFLPVLYAASGWSGTLGAVLTAGVAAINMVGNVAAGRLLSRGVAPRRVLWAAFGAMALGVFLAFATPTAQAPLLRYGGALLFSCLGGMIPGALFGLAPRLAPDVQTVSPTMGWMLQWSAIGQFVGPPFVAWVASLAGGWQWTWLILGSCSLCGAGLAWALQRQLQRSEAQAGAAGA
ncbi:CynX/NimT family MFS transporter [Comamonas sp. NLF-1-9]|uniref:MFS transporter n=1 Tax=Comamonas sp. NLF-1-9 TaxID=2853163 RepID=UPI001C436B02|nr:MFS transporter [Comamonas sp. NLF-1-9]QXL85746.1 MFS transporter [Comamonas sp. NLF-1-9]